MRKYLVSFVQNKENKTFNSCIAMEAKNLPTWVEIHSSVIQYTRHEDICVIAVSEIAND